MSKYTIALIVPYFGSFPNYFHLWLESAKRNSDIDFIIVTDNKKLMGGGTGNIKIISSTLLEVQKRANAVFKMQCKMQTPYKLCDYKPAYGLIFADILRGYDFWGYCDIDIVWGDLRKFITDDLLEQYNRLFNLGHLTLYRNDAKTNKVFMKRLTGVHYTYKEAFNLEYNIGFDEKGCLAGLSKNGNYLQYDNNDNIADIWPDTVRFRTFHTYYSDYDHVYSYENGKVIGHFFNGGRIVRKEFMYIHLQKRKMMVLNHDDTNYLIVPNSFIDMPQITIELIKEYSNDRSPLNTDNDNKEISQISPKALLLRRKIRRLVFAKLLKIDQL